MSGIAVVPAPAHHRQVDVVRARVHREVTDDDVVDVAPEVRRQLGVDVVEVERVDAAGVAVVGDVDREDVRAGVVGDEQHVVGTEGDRTDRLDRRRPHPQTLITHGSTSCTTTSGRDLPDEVSDGAYAAHVDGGRGRGRTGAKCETLSSMETMPAIVYVGEGAIEVQRVDVPELGPGQVRIAVSHCGICGTDLHMVLEQMARPGSGLGHEWAGTIDAVGEGVTDWAPGDRVVAGPGPGCGECRACRRGRPSVCLNRPPMPEPTGHRGAFAQYTTVPAERLLRIPDSLSTRAAALTEPTAIAQHAITLSGVTPEDRVLVTGAGPVGMLVTAVLHAQGIHDITVSEPAPARREHALKVGAARVITPDELPAAIARWSRRRAVLGRVRVLRSR